jgi:3'(2'), 5'-bisphosphate nucleotidase
MGSTAQGRYDDELNLALKLAHDAGDILKTFYQVAPVVQWKNEREPVTEADKAVNAYLVNALARAFPDDAILAEESHDDLKRLGQDRVWLVDPLDGTREFIAHDDEFCVMIGLVQAGRPVVGVVSLPMFDTTCWATLGGGAFLERLGETHALQVSATTEVSRLRPLASRSHRSTLAGDIYAAMGVQKERVAGSLGFKSALLSRGDADFYVHPTSGPKEWDTCAPEIVLTEAGGVMTDCWNRPLAYNQRSIGRKFGVLASNGACQAEVAETVARLLGQAGIDPDLGFVEAPSR